MAAALWHGGIGFGGVVSFIFADLITIPLLLIYRKFYGTALTVRILVTFWALMSFAGPRGRRHLPRVRRDPDGPPGGGRARALPVELHDVLEHRVPDRVGGASTSSPARGASTTAPGVTRPIRRAGCRSRRRTRPRMRVYDGDRCVVLLRRLPRRGMTKVTRSVRHRLGSLVRSMSKIVDILAAGPSHSFEFFPPEDARGRGAARGDAFASSSRCIRRSCRSPTARAARPREMTHDIVTRINRDTELTAMAHLTCAAHTRERVDRDRDALRRRGHLEHPRLARRPAQGSEPAAGRSRPRHRSHRARAGRRRLLGRCGRASGRPSRLDGSRRRPPTASRQARAAPTSASRSSSSRRACGSSSSTISASSA